MAKSKNICLVVKTPWFIRGEHRHTLSMPGDFVSQIHVDDEMSMHLLLRSFVPFDKVVGMLTDDAKLELHHSARRLVELDSNVSYNEALKTTYTDWVSRQVWKVTRRKWVPNLGNGEIFLEITIESPDQDSNKKNK